MSLAADAITVPKNWVGERLKRKEDLRLLNGKGRFIDDLKLPYMHHVAFVRSPYAHARIQKIRLDRALGRSGVAAIFTGKEIAELSNPMDPAPSIPIRYYPMAVEKVRFVGEPIVAVVARERGEAEDAAELVEVEYEPLPPVLSIEQASKPGGSLVHEAVGSNVAWNKVLTYGNIEEDFQSADRTISESFSVHRVSSTPIETFGVVATFNNWEKSLQVYSNTQIPGLLLAILAHSLRIPQSQVRLITMDNGGAFGAKLGLPYLIVLSTIAMKTGLPVKYIETRRENLAALQHGSETKYDAEVAFMLDGSIRSLKVKVSENVGAYPAFPEPEGILEQLYTNAYRIRSYSVNATVFMSNKCVTGPCRGYGRYNSAFLVERIMDIVAKELKLDPGEIRFRNFVPTNDFPYTTPNGNIYDSGDYRKNLRKALDLFGYEKARSDQMRAKMKGRNLGIGMAFIVEIGTPNFAHFGLVSDKPPASLLSNNTEIATVTLDSLGRAKVLTGMAPQGQGHETALAQAVSDELGISPSEVYVDPGFDSNTHPFSGSSGTYGSRFAGVGVSAAVLAARKVREKMLGLAGFMLGEDPANLNLGRGLIFVRNNPKKAIPIGAVCGATYYHSLVLPKEIEPSLSATSVYGVTSGSMPDAQGRLNNGLTYSSSAHIALLEVDKETGKAKVLRYVAVDDCGKQINPMLVEGQTHGGIAHALGWSLFEEMEYDEEGQLVSSSFVDYLIPTAADLPDVAVSYIETPSPFTPLGTKGIGEGGAMPVMPLITSAIEDALDMKARITDTHQSPEKIWSFAKSIR